MKIALRRRGLLRGLLVMLLAAPAASAQESNRTYPLHTIKLPPGFHINLFAGGAVNPRQMAVGAQGTVFAGAPRAGNVYAVIDRDRDGVADDGLVLVSGLIAPNGVAFHDGALFVGDSWRVLRYDDIESHLEHPPKPVVIYDGFPHDTHHGARFIGFGPDGLLYVPVGAPCNVCERAPPYASITRMKPDGTGLEVFARGIRNSVGLDWDPDTHDLWFTDNGRDNLGDDVPADELNHAPRAGMDFGFPYCHARGVLDPQLGGGRSCADFTPPEIELGAHVAALGMRFYTGKMFPEEYRKQIFIAEHGSWNRTTPVGYRIVVARPAQKDESRRVESFAQGWLQPDGKPWGRPADVAVAPDGALLVSDDTAGGIYRITYRE
jgi:glucose/arabinose dehydrogenase